MVIAALSFLIWWYLRGTWLKISALLWAFLLALVIANVAPRLVSTSSSSGIELVSGRLLRIAIALMGLTVSATVWLQLGAVGIAAVLANLTFSFLFGIIVCRYLLKMPLALATLIAGGTAICGASAIAAIGPAIRAKSEEMGTALAAVSLFGLAAMFSYPVLFQGPLGSLLANDSVAYGLWVGMGVHETAQVVAAASQVDGALGMAVMAKSIRIFMIAPIVFASLLAIRSLASREAASSGAVRLSVPWFALAFLALSLVGTLIEGSGFGAAWKPFKEGYMGPAVTFLLTWAFAGVGLKIRLAYILSIGRKGFLGGLLVATAASLSAFLITIFVWV